uniref:TRAF1-6 MATH domain-containing protein n=1 Tax=Amphimedon queenslandica TaxID=400682 RepID=A0A1X7TVS5_AMPQE
MCGEYDALLPWPFSQMVTLMLLDQSGSGKYNVQCFKPEPSSSFWQPKSEMNVASAYVKDDAMFFKVMIDSLIGVVVHGLMLV